MPRLPRERATRKDKALSRERAPPSKRAGTTPPSKRAGTTVKTSGHRCVKPSGHRCVKPSGSRGRATGPPPPPSNGATRSATPPTARAAARAAARYSLVSREIIADCIETMHEVSDASSASSLVGVARSARAGSCAGSFFSILETIRRPIERPRATRPRNTTARHPSTRDRRPSTTTEPRRARAQHTTATPRNDQRSPVATTTPPPTATRFGGRPRSVAPRPFLFPTSWNVPCSGTTRRFGTCRRVTSRTR